MGPSPTLGGSSTKRLRLREGFEKESPKFFSYFTLGLFSIKTRNILSLRKSYTNNNDI